MVFFATILASFFLSCGYGRDQRAVMATCSKKVEQLSLASKTELARGDGDEVIKKFLAHHQIKYSFDRFAKRYQGIIRNIKNDAGDDCAVVIYVYTDDAKKYLKSEFFASYTGT